MKKTGVLPVLFVLTLAVSCLETPDCISLNNNIVGVTFKSAEDSAALTLLFDSVKMEGTPARLDSGVTASKLYLPLNYFSDTTSINFYISDTTVFNVLLQYKTQSQFVAEDCGERYVLSGLTIARSDFDLIKVVNRKPGKNASTNNIEIYF